MKTLLLIVTLLFAGGCGTVTLTNGNKITLHERLGVMGSLQVAEETTFEDEYVDHEIFVGPGLLPLITASSTNIVAGRQSRSESVSTVINSLGDVPSHGHGHGRGHGEEDN